ncbi:MAG: hypothetical protein IT458_18770, partial [Planctomycetes bacterium]|nr:hypothetical protein [Planctomycetota bacterium]
MRLSTSACSLGVLGLAGILAAQAPVKDINTSAPTIPSSSPSNFLTVGAVTYFSANDGLNGVELWKTDGTAAGTVMVKDINPGSASSSPLNFTLFGGFVYFAATTATFASELWRTDGTAAGTTLVKDCYPGTGSAAPGLLTVSGGTLFFSAFDGTATTGTGRELWKSDGTATGTVLVKDIQAGTSSGLGTTFGTMVPFGSGVLFAATTGTVAPGTGEELWFSDGTVAGTVEVKDIQVGTVGSAPRALTAFAGKVFFAASDGTAAPSSGTELWVTDGTAAGTTLLADLYPGTGSSSPEQFVVSSGKLFFSATDSTATTGTGRELYVSDGTGAGTVLVKDLFVGTSNGVTQVGSTSATRLIVPFGTGVLFAGNNGSTVNGEELHFSDGTGAGTVLVADINVGTVSSSPRQLTVAGPRVYFNATTAATGYELFVTDGTGAGTVLTKEIQAGTLAGVTSTGQMAALGGSVVFGGNSGTTAPGTGLEPWVSDGTAAGTLELKDINLPQPSSSSPANLAQLGKLTVFAANDGTSGIEPWVTDGTAAGTVRLIDAYPGASSSSPANFTVLGDKCFFTATNSTATTGTGSELYITDGTPAGTSLLLDINPGTASSSAINLVVSNGKLFFLAVTAAAGRELWVSDGTPAGTTMVVDFLPGASAGVQSFAQSMIPYKNGVMFSGINAGVLSTDAEICFSNGTAAGTYVIDFVPGAPGCIPSPFIEMNGIVYCNATDGANGYELVRTDGTPAGTSVVKDIVPGVGEGNPGPFAVVNNRLYFFATDPATGTELW